MDFQLADKTALVSGSTAGIGLAIATTLAQEGATVVINGRTEERVNAAIDHIKQRSLDTKLQGLVADLGTTDGTNQLFQQVSEVDILVNNLGIYSAKTFAEISDEEWTKIPRSECNEWRAAVSLLLAKNAAKNWGRIIFISSESAINIPAEMIHYGVTKTAQLALARGLAETTVGTNVTVNSVLPGPTRSEGVEDFIQSLATEQNTSLEQIEKEFFAKTRPSSLIQRFATTEEVAALVAFVASPRSSATNGAALRVDGGVVRSIV